MTGVSKIYPPSKQVLKNIYLSFFYGAKIGVLGLNGSGKSSLLRIIAGVDKEFQGEVVSDLSFTVGLLEQEPKLDKSRTVKDIVEEGVKDVVALLKEFEAINEKFADPEIMENPDAMEKLITKQGEIQEKLDAANAWELDTKLDRAMDALRCPPADAKIEYLSGGEKRRVALCRLLLQEPDVLLLDEPTNHLDVEMVEWLENYLSSQNTTLLLVTHDRYFLDAVCKEIWEMNDDTLFVYKGDYGNYLEKKAARLESDTASIEKARNTYRKELEWMRKQPRARTTKSKSRQDNFYEVEKKAKQQIADEQLQLEMKMNRLGGKIAELKKVYKNYGDKIILKGFDYTFKKGDRIGIVGKNGTGKTTFLNLLLGLEKADTGKINIGDTVIFGNYSQQGLLIKEDVRVIEYVKSIAENFPLAKGGSLNAAQFLELFLFPADKQYTYLSMLSGGEKKRLQLLTILFRNPNFLILDEPTNDLDLPTLGVLENFLAEFQGCLVLVSHDRYFMDRLVDHLFVFEGDGVIRDFPGNYSQYRESLLNGTQSIEKVSQTDPVISEPKDPAIDRGTAVVKKRQLTFKEKREFDLLEKEIAELTKEKQSVTQRLNSGDATFEELQQLSNRIGEVSKLLDEKELRWLELSERIE